MRLGVISDIHDNLWNLAPAVRVLCEQADVLLCCGDLCSPFVVDELAKFTGDVHIVFGNNDADLYRITAKAQGTRNVHVHGELFRADVAGKRFAMNHFDYLARPMAMSRQFDVVCFGHNHELEVSRAEGCLLLNPGPVMGAKFKQGWEDTAATFLLLDLAEDKEAEESAVRVFRIDPQTKTAVLSG